MSLAMVLTAITALLTVAVCVKHFIESRREEGDIWKLEHLSRLM
jgi:hypothetical protein